MARGRLVILALLAGCSSPATPSSDAGSASDGGEVVRCSARDDRDMDTISSHDEGIEDRDSDGIPNHLDPDSDGDGISDADEAGDANCMTAPIDRDGDGAPDFLDRDGNGDGIDDSEQIDADVDGDGTPDWRDRDVDGDGIDNDLEWGPDPARPADTDEDGTPDLRDTDSDGDSIADVHESAFDSDRDGTPNYRDLDSDDDGVEDALEAGDGVEATPPIACSNEIDPTTGLLAADGLADYVDTDSDNDGWSDGDEREIGTNACDIDSDDDGVDDLAEGAYERYNCPDGTTGTDCGCATSAGCTIPDEHFYVVLPYGGAPVERDLDFSTSIRVADVFFLTDNTGSMGGVLTRVQTTVSTPGTGLIDRIRETIPDAWFGGGAFQDFPFGGYGSSGDQAFRLTIAMTPPERSAEVQTAFASVRAAGGADTPESHSEALYQTVTGEGGTFLYSGAPYMLRRYLGDCLDTGWGAPCFRESALPIIVMFSDVCGHNGPPGESTSCSAYSGFTPEPHSWTEAIAAMNTRGAKFVGVATNGNCASTIGPDGTNACYFMRQTALETRSVDLDGNPLAYNLPSSGGTDAVFIDTIVGAIETVATRVPLDVDTALRDDRSDTVDARRFIHRRQPACRATPPATTCWEAPAGVAHEQAVAFTDQSTFFGVVPGTRVTFRITFRNDFLEGGREAQVYIAFIDVRGGGNAVLDTRQVFVVVPGSSGGPM